MKKTAIVGSLALAALLTPTAAYAAPTGAATPATQTADAATATALAAIAQAAAAAQLGSATSAATPIAHGLMQSFGAGAVYYSATTGAHAVTGAILAHYQQPGNDVATIGFPTADVADGGVASRVQRFESGQIVSSEAAGTKTVRGAIAGTYDGLEGTKGVLALPTTDEVAGAAANSRASRFQGGTVVWTPSTGANAVYGAIATKYAEFSNEGGVLGVPTTSEMAGANGARLNAFANGTIVWSPGTGAHAVYGAINGDYKGLGREASPLGKPRSDEFTGVPGARVSNFEGGTIIWSPGTGAHAVYGAIYSDFASLGWEGGVLGKPLTDEFSGSTGARVNRFEGGTIVWSPGTGAHAVYGAIYGEFAQQGYEAGVLGKPLTDESQGANGARVNKFENGRILWTSRTGAHTVRGWMLDQYLRLGGEGGSLGAPTGNEYAIAGGHEQQFEHGKLTLVNGQFVDPASKAAAAPQAASGNAQRQPLASAAPSSSQRQRIVDFARSQVGKAYATGGTGPNAYDCSGFVQAAYAAAGISIPRVSWSQLGAGRVIPLSSAQPGDIVGFYGGEHVSIYIGNGQVIHAGNYSTGVEYIAIALMPYYETVTYL